MWVWLGAGHAAVENFAIDQAQAHQHQPQQFTSCPGSQVLASGSSRTTRIPLQIPL
jgi:hypothetical protein